MTAPSHSVLIGHLLHVMSSEGRSERAKSQHTAEAEMTAVRAFRAGCAPQHAAFALSGSGGRTDSCCRGYGTSVLEAGSRDAALPSNASRQLRLHQFVVQIPSVCEAFAE